MLEQAFKTARTLLPNSSSVTVEQIENAINITLSIPQYSEVSRSVLLRRIEEIYSFWRLDSTSIERDPKPWLKEKRSSINWNFWNRYKHYLEIDKGMSQNILDQLEKDVDKALDKLFDPSINSSANKYGLVVGQVQSGKTSNYTGLICKAADAGYQLIIVLAGIHNNLRSQTQLRLDEGFLGFNTRYTQKFDTEIAEDIRVGVGKISKNEIAHSLTSCRDNGDFSKSAFNSLGLNFNTNQPIIAVVKKNSKVLERLLIWLTAQSVEMPNGRKVIKNKSFLMIDDEADNASINTNPDEDKSTKINSLIRDVLRLFDKSGYVGYTATPFANIFIPIEEDQIFPRDFIINIPAPSNYIGPDKVFGIKLLEDAEESESTLPIVNRIDDYNSLIPNGHKKTGVLPAELPESLRQAIKCFIITCTIRRLRGQTTNHNSMLIHVSRFTNWQKHIKTLVENTFDFYRRGIEMGVDSVLEELRKTFEEDNEYSYEYKGETIIETYKSFKSVSKSILDNNSSIDSQVQVHEWTDLLEHINDATSRIQVREINGGSGDVLNYFDHKNGLSVIAIGGDKLSRGLTLEGLSISYYLRASRMYDTLMQMGRWFGYRPGYVDLCRLFTSRELNEWFCHITLASEELRAEFDYMADVAGSTPEQYALRVRTHPGVLQISASNKIRRATDITISWAGRLIETYQLSIAEDNINNNIDNVRNFNNRLGTPNSIKVNSFLWMNVDAELIKEFLSNFKIPESLQKVNPLHLIDFINVSNKVNELTAWNVAFMSKKDGELYNLTDEMKIGLYERTNDPNRNGSPDTYFIKKNHIISPSHEFIDLDDDVLKKAYERTVERTPKYKYAFPSGEVVRNSNEFRKVPLLIVYLLNPKSINEDRGSIYKPIAGFAISFPNSKTNPTVTYKVHEQLLDIFKIDDDIENENNDED